MKTSKIARLSTLLLVATFYLLNTSCEKLVEVGPPNSLVTSQDAFKNDATAASTVFGLYATMSEITSNPVLMGTTVYTGLACDELEYTGTSSLTLAFSTNSILPDNIFSSASLWTKGYNMIYQANSCIEGLAKSATISDPVKKQLTGECKFLRSLIYYNMINIYGDVPLVTTTDYQKNATLSRSAISAVQDFIEMDLQEAANLLPVAYPSAGRVRANKWTATALLARVYLYRGKFSQAESAANAVISSGVYSFENELAKVFLSTSPEAIFQIMSLRDGYNTYDASVYIPSTAATAIPTYVLSKSLLDAFEKGDRRRMIWVNEKIVNTKTYAYPYKYKVPRVSGATTVTEYTMVIRLTEMYLIRAEARANGTDLAGAIQDINLIRSRARDVNVAGALPEIEHTSSPAQVLSAIEKERRIELYAEHGSRWADLKRSNRIDAVMTQLRPNFWQPTDKVFPIPQVERDLNPNLTQNDGYTLH